jgi:hypothetical protein
MSKGIFVSSASPDAEIVRRLLGRLRNLGLDPPAGLDLPRLWHYELDMEAGDEIFAKIDKSIDQSQLALLCLSDEALRRPWIAGEAALLKKAHREERLQHVIPIKVGPVTISDASLKPVRDFVTSQDDFVADVTTGAETELEKVAGEIHAKLGLHAPKKLVIAVIAMTSVQAADLLRDWEQMHARNEETPGARVSAAVGLRPPELFELVRTRYGAKPEDMMPFRGESVMEIVHEELQQANDRRVRTNRYPLFPRWIHGELFSTQREEADRARLDWDDNDSLLVVDSISTYHREIAQQLQLVPRLDPATSAVVCLPPYTRRTVELEDAFRDAFSKNREAIQLLDWFNMWSGAQRRDRGDVERMVAFDTVTSVSLKGWLERRFVTVPGEYAPQDSGRRKMPSTSFKSTPSY